MLHFDFRCNPLRKEADMRDLLDATRGAVTECADAALGDVRRTQRLVQLAHALAQRPGAALPEACGSGAMRKAASRLFTNEDMAPDAIVHSHIEATSSRLNTVPLVLAVQDTTEANGTHVRVTEGLGPLGHPACHGLLVHTTLALPPERVPMGLLAPQVWARDPDDMGKRARRPAGGWPVARRCGPCPFGPRRQRRAAGGPAGTVGAVRASEVEPPAEAEPIEWLWLTAVAVETVDAAIERVQWDAGRWGMEVWHRMVKSGGHLDARQCQKAERLRRALALSSVLAWRMFYATMRARAVPEAPCSVLLEPRSE